MFTDSYFAPNYFARSFFAATGADAEPVAPIPDVTVRSREVAFRQINAASLVQQLEGPEPAYPVYVFGQTRKFERPEVSGQEYRWLMDQEEFD